MHEIVLEGRTRVSFRLPATGAGALGFFTAAPLLSFFSSFLGSFFGSSLGFAEGVGSDGGFGAALGSSSALVGLLSSLVSSSLGGGGAGAIHDRYGLRFC